MADRAALVQEIRSCLKGGIPVLTRHQVWDVYEVYLFGLVVAAAREEGATVEYLGRDGRRQTSLVLRAAPGHLYSSVQNYGYALLDFSGVAPLEVHLGVKVAGNSRVPHECDVAVLKSSEADRCRRAGAIPRCSQLVLAMEAKFYSAGLELGLARAFLGLRQDLGGREVHFVCNISSPSVAKLLARRASSSWSLDVTPGSADVLVGQIRRVFKNHKAGR